VFRGELLTEAMRHSPAHALNTIKEFALVILSVTEIDDGERDQSSYDESHFVSLRAEKQQADVRKQRVDLCGRPFLIGQSIRRSN
jgi:hypothetical protein